jgi:hypothetical protein
VRFPSLFQKCADPDISIDQAYVDSTWQILFRGNFNLVELQLWQELLGILEGISLDEDHDKLSWTLDPSRSFTTKLLYQTVIKSLEVPITSFIWEHPIPLKIKIFTWQLAQGCLPSNDQI